MNNVHQALENTGVLLWMIFFVLLVISIVVGILIWKFKNR